MNPIRLTAILLLLLLLAPLSAHARIPSLQTGELAVYFDAGAEKAAYDVLEAYPAVREELSALLGQKVDFRPEVRLVKGGETFRKMAGSDRVAAFAVPGRDLIVLDGARAFESPFSLDSTLSHELCHLLLHHAAGERDLPRWFDEGVCQWASGGVAEVASGDAGSALAKAAAGGTLIPLRQLETFPREEHSFFLAYGESRSVVEYISGEFGKRSIGEILGHLQAGDSLDDAFRKTLSLSPAELEEKWRASLTRRYTWFSYLSSALTPLLFLLAALVTVCGFIRMLKRKKAYRDEEEEESAPDRE
ncbi:MAG: peptidase MA family metallohydrolase [Thermodesulfovibrionales bacterium]